MEQPDYNKDEASRYLGVSVRTLQRMSVVVKEGETAPEGKIPGYTWRNTETGRDETRFFKRNLDAYLHSRRKQHVSVVPAAPPPAPTDVTPDTALVRASQVQETLNLLASMLEDRRLLDDRFLTYKEASEEFGLSMAVLRRAVADGRLNLYPIGRRGAKVLRLSEVRQFIREM